MAALYLPEITPGHPVGDIVVVAGLAVIGSIVMPGIIAMANGAAFVALVAEAMDVEALAQPYLQRVRPEPQPQDSNDDE